MLTVSWPVCVEVGPLVIAGAGFLTEQMPFFTPNVTYVLNHKVVFK